MTAARRLVPTATHWGAYLVEVDGDHVAGIRAHPADSAPSPIGLGMVSAAGDAVRIRRPMARLDWLEARERGRARPSGRRGEGRFVALDPAVAYDLAAAEIDRVRTELGNAAIFGGSYGWGSAGRFHHPQSQVHRFLATAGGYTASVGNYSFAALAVVLPHVLGCSYDAYRELMPTWDDVAAHGELVVAFGGLSTKNGQVNGGGVLDHQVAAAQRRCRAAGVRFVNVSPLRGDVDPALDAEWIPIRPNTDVALMLGLLGEIVAAGRHDRDFLVRCCVGWTELDAYLAGHADGVRKTAEWAAPITGIPAHIIRSLAARIVDHRTLISATWSLQRADHGEQVPWTAIALSAASGSMGRAGGGFGTGYGCTHSCGLEGRLGRVADLPRVANAVRTFIPVARIANLLLQPGETFDFDGERHVYPHIELVHWCGGNPFHHHQDLNRLVEAWQRPATVIVHEPWWNALARHADLIFPSALPFEREDIAAGHGDRWLVPMRRATPPPAGVTTDYEVFSAIAGRLGVGAEFTEGRSDAEWIRELYERTRAGYAAIGHPLPPFDAFWDAAEPVELPAAPPRGVAFAELRADPERHPLGTPSGRIELYSETVAGFRYPDCPPSPTWLEPAEWLGSAGSGELHLLSNQPRHRLHSQLDNGSVSQAAKVSGREPIALNPHDASERGIAAGDVVRVHNGRGACLAGAVVDDGVAPGVAVLPTGAWYDPVEPGGLDVHGNPNTLTTDRPTSRLAQGPAAQTVLVEVERFEGAPPPLRVFDPPCVLASRRGGGVVD